MKQATSNVPKEVEDDLVKIFDEIDEKQQKIAEKKERAQEEWHNGARATKHRFTL
ncbi:TPA: hypothetical protein ACXRW3_000174 [Klebsiella quasipneumoniae subsp. quasipneumoniae]|uniref:hypothetical protein n=1 Tax=Klebsiella TaxID=570 RepID=UPI001CF6DE8E|nr:hypothetical protein [Klebsiella pneumoniae]MCM5811783.1 hypothetical protein [Klebsiella pneumoniae]MCP6202170.1 hypothetical protein [Klebsiella pneumoniae]MCS6708214.1 hypothetical protein [Klebsiella pneumoniae subsp. pneumoniae]MCT4359071.1 hypothetical protein [Klebsiella pneumoniae]MDE4625863.1 hypothetical protein [Klebsiella pneumoniae]